MDSDQDRKGAAEIRDWLQSTRLSRRQAIKALLAAGIAPSLVLAACTPAPPPAPTQAAGAQPPAATPQVAGATPVAPAQPAAGRATTLIMAAAEVAPNLDMEYALQPSTHFVWDQVLERPVEWTPKPRNDGFFEPDFTKPEPRLVESWDYAPDAKSIVWHLRKGVMSHAGNEMTADDWKWTWDRKFALKGVGGFFTSILNMPGPESVKVIDKYTVQFTSSAPTPIFVSIQTQGYQGIMDSTEVKKHATTDDPWATKWLANNMVGFGPYKLDQLSPGREVSFTRHEQYYRTKPQMQRVLFRQVPASSNRVALLVSGDVDVVPDLLPRELNDLQGKSGVKVVNWVGNQLTSVVMNLLKPPFDKVEVRKALNYATPYKDILQTVYFNMAQQMKSPYASIYPMATQEYWNYDTDIAKAKQLLTQAGYPNGFETEIAISTAFPEVEQVAVLMQTSFAQIGVKMAVSKMPNAVHQERTSKREFPLFIQWEQANCPDPGYSLYLYYHSKSFLDYADLKDPKFDQLVDQISSSTDDTQRLPWAKEAQRILIQDDVPWIWLVHSGSHLGMRSDLSGLTWKTTNSFEFNEIKRG